MSEKRYLSMSKFGRYGRFGNQLFQYSFLRTITKLHDLELMLPGWAGSKLFGCGEPPVTVPLPTCLEVARGLHHGQPPEPWELFDHDYEGYSQYHTSHLAPHREFVRGLFQPVPKVASRVEPARDRLRETGKTVIGIHLRRGDYGQSIFPIIPAAWYLRWLEKYWEQFDSPTLFIATEDLSLVDEFSLYNPQTIDTLRVEVKKNAPDPSTLKYDIATHNWRAMDYYPDFYLLSQADVILMPNSTFSFFAAMLSEGLRELWRADLDAGDFVRVDPWNDWPILRQPVKRYPHLKGIALKTNEYW